jgi:hypothetical protein
VNFLFFFACFNDAFVAKTPLCFAATCGNPNAVESLIKCSTDLHVKDAKGFTPFHYVVIGGYSIIHNSDVTFYWLIKLNKHLAKRVIFTPLENYDEFESPKFMCLT